MGIRGLVLTLSIGVLVGCGHSDVAQWDPMGSESPSDSTIVSAQVVRLSDGAVIWSRDAELLLHPASTMKLLTTITIARRAPDFAVATTFEWFADGTLLIRGQGDPLLTIGDLSPLVDTLRARGARATSVAYVDPSEGQPRFGEGWMWDDEPGAYMPHLSGLMIDGSTVLVSARGTEMGTEVRLVPTSAHTPLRKQDGHDAESFSVTRDWQRGSPEITWRGSVPPGKTEDRRLSVPDPARHAACCVAELLAQNGLAEPDAPIIRAPTSAAPGEVVFTVRHGLSELLAKALKPSDNLTAEMLLRHLGGLATRGAGLGTAEEGLAAIEEQLQAGGSTRPLRLADGSGMSHYGLVSAALLTDLLANLHREAGPAHDLIREALAVAGEDGTLANRFRGTPLAGQLRGKTGTVAGVSNLAGYFTTRSGERMAFAILVQNYVGSARPWRELQDRLCLRMYESW